MNDNEDPQDQNALQEVERWAKLMAQAQEGDKVAYEELLNAITPMLRIYILRKLNQRADSINSVDDVLQETLISIHKARHTFDPTKPLIPWIMAIAKYRSVDYIRKVSPRLKVEEPETEYADKPSLDNPNAVFEARDFLKEALQVLNERQLLIVKLMKIDDLSIADVAEETGLSQSVVKVTLHRALKLLRGKFGIFAE